MWLFMALVMVPIVEIALFIQVGGVIGLWPTLAIVLATAFAGSWLIRTQGVGALMALRGSISTLNDPTRPLFDGAAIIFAGALLLTPGFLTDTMGLLLLVPPVRSLIFEYLRKRVTVVGLGPGARPAPTARGDVIEGEFREVGEAPRRRED